MWVFRKLSNSVKGVYEIGYYDPSGNWHGEMLSPDGIDAMRCCNYLSGGSGDPPQMKGARE